MDGASELRLDERSALCQGLDRTLWFVVFGAPQTVLTLMVRIGVHMRQSRSVDPGKTLHVVFSNTHEQARRADIPHIVHQPKRQIIDEKPIGVGCR
jgi:hypothetical protein